MRKIFFFTLALLTLVAIMNFMAAAITISLPAGNSASNSSLIFNVTYINATDFTSAVNATFYYNISGAWTSAGTASCGFAPSTQIGYCSMGFSPSSTEGVFSINASISNSSSVSWASALMNNVIFDNKAPSASFSGDTINKGNYSQTITLNALVSDGISVSSVYFSIINSTGNQANFTKASGSAGNYNLLLATTAFPDGIYNITIYANDTLGNVNNSQSIQITIDNTAPAGTFTCSPPSVSVGQAVACTCTPSDAVSGINNTATSFNSIPSVAAAGNYTLSCTFYDMAGNTATLYTNYTVLSSQNQQQNTGINTESRLINAIIPGNSTIINGFSSKIPIDEIQINAASQANNVNITATEYDDKPDAVSSEPSSRIFEYFHIDTQNLGNLQSAVMKIRVTKEWMSSNSLTQSDITLFKYDETLSNWSQLQTTFSEEDDTYDYYSVNLNSFSYFAIGQKPSSIQNNPRNSLSQSQSSNTNPNLIWIVLVGIVAFAILLVSFILLRRKRKDNNLFNYH